MIRIGPKYIGLIGSRVRIVGWPSLFESVVRVKLFFKQIYAALK